MKKLLILFAMALQLLSCTKPIPDLELKSTEPISFAKTGGSSTISFTAYTSWTASTDATWLTISPAQGEAGIEGALSSVKVTAKTNDEFDDRNATVSIVSNDKTFSVTVKQAKKTGIYLTEREKTVDYTAQAIVMSGQANVERKVEIDESCSDWISCVSTKALASFDLTFNIAENTAESDRTGTVYIKSDDPDAADSFTITQKGKPSILFCEIPGIYKKRVLKAGFTEYESQTGFFSRAAGTTEFHIVNAASRKYCVFKNMKPVSGESAPASPFSVDIRQNMASKLDAEFSLSAIIYKYENGYIWAEDTDKSLGVIIKVK